MSKARNEALAGMTKAELIKTIKALDKRQTQLLNEISAKDKLRVEQTLDYDVAHVTAPPPAFPWSS